MEPKHELPPANYTPTEQAELEKSRTISDGELLKGGAEYVVTEKEEKKLYPSNEQINELQIAKHWESIPAEKVKFLQPGKTNFENDLTGEKISSARGIVYREGLNDQYYLPGIEYYEYLKKNPEKFLEKFLNSNNKPYNENLHFFGGLIEGKYAPDPFISFSKGNIMNFGINDEDELGGTWYSYDKILAFER